MEADSMSTRQAVVELGLFLRLPDAERNEFGQEFERHRFARHFDELDAPA